MMGDIRPKPENIIIHVGAARLTRLARMAKEAGITPEALASRLLCSVLDDDAVAHGEKVGC